MGEDLKGNGEYNNRGARPAFRGVDMLRGRVKQLRERGAEFIQVCDGESVLCFCGAHRDSSFGFRLLSGRVCVCKETQSCWYMCMCVSYATLSQLRCRPSLEALTYKRLEGRPVAPYRALQQQ